MKLCIDSGVTMGGWAATETERSSFLHRLLARLLERQDIQQELLENDLISAVMSHPQRSTEDDYRKAWKAALRTATSRSYL